MYINPYNDKLPFGTIKLTPADLTQTKRLLKNIAQNKDNTKRKNSFAINLYKVFLPYLQQEAKQKAKASYALEEVFSDIKVKFWEFIYDINDKNDTNSLIQKIDKYVPSRILSRLKYNERSLDDFIPNTKKLTLAESITSEQLPVAQSEIKKEEIKHRLDTEIMSTRMSQSTRRRVKARSKGLTYSEIAEKEGVGVATVRKSVNRGILTIQNQNGVISEKNQLLISRLANLLCTTFDKVLNMVIAHIEILSSSPEVIKRNIEVFPRDFNMSKKEFIKIAFEQPLLFYQKPETINKNIESSAKIFNISKEQFLIIASKRPQLFSYNPETLDNKLKSLIELLETPKEEIVKIIFKQPQLLTQNPKSFNKNIENSAILLKIPKTSFIKAGLKHSALLYQKPQTLNKNIESAAKIFNITKEEYIEAALKRPQLFSCLPETLNRNIEDTAKKLDITKEEYIKLALKRPQLFNIKPETVNKNVKTSAKLLSINKSEFIKAALKQSQLLYQKPETINKNTEASAKVFGMSKAAFVKMALKQPSLFFQNPETLAKKVKIINYSNKFNQKTKTAAPSGRSVLNSDEKLYKNILFQIMQKKIFTSLTKTQVELKLAEFLNSSKDVIAIEIPKFDYVEDFIKFAENFSRKVAGKNIFQFTVQE